jgi:4-hydroxythreonine-4-phosphate dehydrogenase
MGREIKPIVAVTMGDPVGVGPEIVLRALEDRSVRRACAPVVIGDEGLLNRLAKRLGTRPLGKGAVIDASRLKLTGLKPGVPTRASSGAMIGYIERAVAMTLAREADAIATAPISKEAAKKAGFRFPGHTEFLAHLTGAKDFRMMLGGKALKVVLVTIHEPIRKVPRLITTERVHKTIKITDDSFKRYFGLKRPRIAVAGLNPHAGEGGIFGDEEKRLIAPAVRKARRIGIDATGPLPPDTVFYRAVRKEEFDCVVCMYHDQGLGPVKLLHFEDGINVTLGLPIIRTSVDHGTAYDIAWKGTAGHGSMVNAIVTAAEMAKRKNRQ